MANGIRLCQAPGSNAGAGRAGDRFRCIQNASKKLGTSFCTCTVTRRIWWDTRMYSVCVCVCVCGTSKQMKNFFEAGEWSRPAELHLTKLSAVSWGYHWRRPMMYLQSCDYLLFRVCFVYFDPAIIACEWHPAKPRTGQPLYIFSRTCTFAAIWDLRGLFIPLFGSTLEHFSPTFRCEDMAMDWKPLVRALEARTSFYFTIFPGITSRWTPLIHYRICSSMYGIQFPTDPLEDPILV